MAQNIATDDIPWARGFTDPADVRQQATTIREMVATRRVWRGDGPKWTLPTDYTDLSGVTLNLPDQPKQTVSEFLAGAHSDGIAVLHRGRIVYESYLHGCKPHEPHLNASMAKSYVGLMAALVEAQGLFDRDDRASKFIPELAGTAFGDNRIQDLLHMGTDVTYGGRPFHRTIEASRFWAVVAPKLRPMNYRGPETILEHLATARTAGPTGVEFRYENGNVETVGEILRRVTGTSLAELLSELVWSRIGAEEDAFYIVDSAGTEMAAGGFSATLRDVARVGEMIRCDGAVEDRQVIPPHIARSMTAGVPAGYPSEVRSPRAPVDAPATMSYHDYWWILNDPFGSFMASGIHGQRLLISRDLEFVVAHFGAHILSPAIDTPNFVPAFLQIGTHLVSNARGAVPVS
ncbi:MULTISPECIES: serine hydrolase domain-containing protein [Rhodococcus]|uniref:serine hydrolase domain-containing protein n=1 Tax=Rhodococcus TaxID=1827 RepID=UPI0002B7DDC0|nr:MULTISPECIES: serine hydrolase [Rhodococcus]EME17159.1 amide hydrolase [Rhodococcus qingshengii BKS 20-40]